MRHRNISLTVIYSVVDIPYYGDISVNNSGGACSEPVRRRAIASAPLQSVTLR